MNTEYHNHFRRLTADEVDALARELGPDCYEWDAVEGTASVRFDSEDEFNAVIDEILEGAS